MNRYHRYQNVNSYWYDEVPDHWKKTKNKYVFHQDKKVVGSSWEDYVLLTMGKFGVKPRDMDGGGKFPASFENYQVVTPNQIIFCLFDIDETPRTVGKSSDHGMITSAYDVFSTSTGNDPQFWTYFYQMIDDHKGLRPYYTGLRKVVRSETFMGIEVFSPPIEEQKLISRYLDKKTNQIDSLVEKIQKKIELLKEQRTTLINHFVTKGLDPNVEMKDSGVEWIGEIPKHWEVTRLKHISQVSLSSVDRHEHDDELKVSICHYPDVYKNEYITTQTDLPSGTCSESEFLKFALRDGDVLLTKDSESPDDIGIPTFVRGSLENTVCGYHLGVIRSSSGKTHSNYLYRFIESKSAKDYFFTKSSGITRFGLGKGSIENLKIPLPPQDEQIEIAKKIDYISDKKSKISENLLVKITLLKEYRQSLISSVVTGKVRVTEDMI